MKNRLMLSAGAAVMLAMPLYVNAQTATLFGAMANFDVYNDTGQDTHGFEIEIDGVTASNVQGYFSATRYGAPTVTPFANGVYVRWAASYNLATQQWSATTTQPAAFTPTTGHSCVMTAIIGCDHYGVWSVVNPTNVVYRWLVQDPNNPGSLIPFTTANFVPHPFIYVQPPAQGGAAPVVVFQVKAAPAPPAQFGPAKWVKVYKNEQAQEVALDELVGGDPIVPEDPGSVETAWKLLQTNPNGHGPGDMLSSQGSLGAGSRAVVRRYEFYKYAGKLDPLTKEALCIDPTCGAPGAGELGDYIGSQMAAANVGVPSVTVTKIGAGTVTGAGGKINCGGSCTTTLTAGATITLTANPGGGLFSGWGGACNGLDLNCNLTVNDALNVTATFTPVFTLSIGRSGNGTVTGNPAGVFSTQIACGGSCSAKFGQGTVVTLTATPAAGQNFTGWSGACSGTAPTCSVTIAADTKVQANFK